MVERNEITVILINKGKQLSDILTKQGASLNTMLRTLNTWKMIELQLFIKKRCIHYSLLFTNYEFITLL